MSDFFNLIGHDNKKPAKAAQPTAKKKKKTKGPEATILDAIVRWLKANGAIALRVNSGYLRDAQGHVFNGAPAGTSDIVCCWRGRFVAIEVKAGNNQPTEKQKAFLNKVIAAGGIALVANSLELVKVALDKVPPLG